MNTRYLLLLFISIITIQSCKKYLDKKSDKSVVIPGTLEDLQAVLDDYQKMNVRGYPSSAEVISDDYYVTDADWGAVTEYERMAYIWNRDLPSFVSDWKVPYQVVYTANVVLTQLDKLKSTGPQELYEDIKGQALFFRAFAFYQLAQIYCKPYSSTNFSLAGISIRLVPDLEEESVRATVKETYEQIIKDFTEAVNLLPNRTTVLTRPNKGAAYAALARAHLSMGQYADAGKFAGMALNIKNSLMDYNELNSTADYPIERMNKEILFHSNMYDNTIISTHYYGRVDSNLFNAYDINDLRKQIFFITNSDNTHGFKGSYDGSYLNFNGFATDELYLIEAESYARTGNESAAIDRLNTLLKSRWKSNEFIPISAGDPNEVLMIVLQERRKELLMRGIRWTDLRRLNLEGAGITLKRVINGTTYTLPPDDNRWVQPIPQEVINLTNMSQNPR